MSLRRLCRAPGCDDLAVPGDNRCADHRLARDRAEAERKAAVKLTAGAREGGDLYNDRRWRKARAAYLTAHPMCCDCASVGIVTAAQEVDHIRPHRGDRTLFWSRANWQGLCKPCHSRKTAGEVLNNRPRGVGENPRRPL